METFAPPRPSDTRPPVRALECVPFEHVFFPPWQVAGAKAWPTDAHFCTYRVTDPSDPNNLAPWPRCNKSLLPELRARGCDLMTTMVVLDYDNPGHRRWNPGEVQQFANYLVDVAKAGFWIAMAWTAFYTTRNGARFVYVLKDEIRVDQAKPYLLGVIRDFRSAGVKIDESCKDWTRLFRAPYVVRRIVYGKQGSPQYAEWNENSWEDPNFQTHLQLNNRLDLRYIVPTTEETEHEDVVGEHLELEQPDNSCVTMLEDINPTTNRRIQSEWYKKAKQLLIGRDCYHCIFDGAPLAAHGSRDNTIQAYVGAACSILSAIPATTPELVYALFLPAVLKLEPDSQTPDWTVVLWKAVLRYWGKEIVRMRDVEVKEEAKIEEQQTLAKRVLAGMRQWCDDPHLKTTSESDALQWASERLIASCSRFYFVMTPDGHYDGLPVPKELLVARVRALGMEPLIPLRQPNANGMGYKAMTGQDLLNNHGTICARVEGVAGGPGTMIRNMDREDAVFVMRLYWRRTDLTPTWNADVDQWLRLLFGKEYERGIEWLSHALAVEDGPMCALSIHGAPGSGKQMLATGLAECWNTEACAGAEEFGKYQSGLLTTPIVTVNEGFQHDRNAQKDIADVFRSLVSGDPVRVEEKFKPLITIRVPVRILITANNDEAVTTLTSNRDLSEYDREALAIRLMHMKTTHDAALWLKGMGGMSFTGAKNNRWVRSTSGDPSNYVLAKHIMYLYEHRLPPIRGQRLLVEGGLGTEVEKLIRTRSGFAPEIIETIIQLIETDNPQMYEGIAITETGRIYVTVGQVLKFHRAIRTMLSGKSASEKIIRSVLKSLVVTGDIEEPRELLNRRGVMVRAEWFELDLVSLYNEAIAHGYQCAKLTGILRKQQNVNPFGGQASVQLARQLGVTPPPFVS